MLIVTDLVGSSHAYELADALGWTKTYDAEPLARLEGAVVLTARMQRRAGGTGLVIDPGEL